MRPIQIAEVTTTHRSFNQHPTGPDVTLAYCLFTYMSLPFQSASGVATGCNVSTVRLTFAAGVFQSSSGREAGCNQFSTGCIYRNRGFNPHPAWRPDATLQRLCNAIVVIVSIRVWHGSGCNAHRRTISRQSMLFQSASGMEARCDVNVAPQMLASNAFRSASGMETGCDA